MKCPYCGNEHSDSAKFCENTGKSLVEFKEDTSCCQKLGIDFDRIGRFNEKSAAVVKNNKYGLIIQDDDNKIKLFLECKYDEVLPFSEGRCAIRESGRWSFIDRSGRTVLELDEDYNVTSDLGYRCGLCRVSKLDENSYDLLYGFVDRTGREVIQCQYDYVTDFDQKTLLAAVTIYEGADGYQEQFLIDKYGNQRSDKAYTIDLMDGYSVSAFHRKEKLVECIETGEQVILKKTNQLEISNDVCAYTVEGRLTIFNLHSPNVRKSFKQQVWLCELCSDGLIGVELENPNVNPKDNNAGYINSECNVIIPFVFKNVSSFHDGLAAVIPNGKDKWGFINPKGQLVIDCLIDEWSSFNDGIASVVINGKWTVIDRFGTPLI